MTKQEAIRKTEYTESELINLALTIAFQRAQAWRDEAQDDAEAWDHYENLRQAFNAIYCDRIER